MYIKLVLTYNKNGQIYYRRYLIQGGLLMNEEQNAFKPGTILSADVTV
ncbi:hypothetical protein [Ferdinandcohnia sp. Marseille-Q9671]